jgi:large subunit ribosomal protein L31
MKSKIHPKYYKDATITCSCGNVFKVGSTVETLEVEICSACHPFYTGKKKLIDSAGQVDRFKKKMEMAKKMKADQEAAAKAKKSKTTKSTNQPKADQQAGKTEKVAKKTVKKVAKKKTAKK